MGTNFTDYSTPLACGCSLKDGRCQRHALMMKNIRDLCHGDKAQIIWSLQDGYGVVGYTPEQGWDWSGIRDSSIEAIEAMFEAATR